MACLITGGSAFDCADVQPGGIDQFLMLYNLQDWKDSTITLDVTDGFITDIVNATGKQAYEDREQGHKEKTHSTLATY